MDRFSLGVACIANTLYTPQEKWLNIFPYECKFIANIKEEIEGQKACIVIKYNNISECMQYLIVARNSLKLVEGEEENEDI